MHLGLDGSVRVEHHDGVSDSVTTLISTWHNLESFWKKNPQL